MPRTVRTASSNEESAEEQPAAPVEDVTRPAERKAEALPGPESGDATGRGAEDAPAPEPRKRLWPAALAAAAALVLLVGTLVVSLQPRMRDTDRAAAVDSARTTLESLLSYSGAKFDAHVAEVSPRLTAPFKDQFTKVAATDIKPMAVKNGATVQAKVYDAGVMDTTGDGGDGSTVRIMAFVNQATTTSKEPTPAIDQNRVIVTMKRVGDRWLVSDLAAF